MKIGTASTVCWEPMPVPWPVMRTKLDTAVDRHQQYVIQFAESVFSRPSEPA